MDLRARGTGAAGLNDAFSPQALSALIGAIYDCALDPERWEATLAAIKDALDFMTAELSLADLRNNAVIYAKDAGMKPGWAEIAIQHQPEINARLMELLPKLPSLDDPVVILHSFNEADRAASPYYRAMLAEGVIDVMQFTLLETPERRAALGLARHETQGPVTDRDIVAGKLLLPHIRRAVLISNVLDAQAIARAKVSETLDGLRCGVLLTDARGTILHANRSAEDMLARGDLVKSVRNVLSPAEPTAARELRVALRLAAGDEAAIGRTGLAIRLTAPETVPVFAHVLPLSGSEVRTRLQPEAAAAVFVGAPSEEQDTAAILSANFGLTPAETRVVAAILAGHTHGEIAATLGIGRTTVKSHMKHVLAKTGTRRQAELTRLAMRVSPPAGDGR